MSVLISLSVFLIFVWFPLAELGTAFSGCWRLEGWWDEVAQKNLGQLTGRFRGCWAKQLGHTWQTRCNKVQCCNSSGSLGRDCVLSECNARIISVVMCGLWGPIYCELVLIKGQKKFIKALSLCRCACNQIAMYFTSWRTELYKACVKS